MDAVARHAGGEFLHVTAHCLVEAFVGAASAAMLSAPCCFVQSESFRPPSEGESLSLCVAKEKVTKEKGHPAWRLPPIHGRQVRESGPGFSTAHPCAGEKESASCRFPLRGLSTPPHRRTGAPGRAAGHPGPHSVRNGCAAAKAEERAPSTALQIPVRPERSEAKSKGDVAGALRLRPCGLRSGRTEARNSYSAMSFASAFGPAFPGVRAGCALLYRGPCAAVRDGRQARRVIGRDADHFSPGQDALSKNPAGPHGLAGHGCPASAKRGGLSLWLSFSLATQRESNSVAEGDRPLFAQETTRASRLKSLLQMSGHASIAGAIA
jgi:hypothetical protein